MNLRELLQQISECDSLESEVYIEDVSTKKLYCILTGAANSDGVFLILDKEVMLKPYGQTTNN